MLSYSNYEKKIQSIQLLENPFFPVLLDLSRFEYPATHDNVHTFFKQLNSRNCTTQIENSIRILQRIRYHGTGENKHMFIAVFQAVPEKFCSSGHSVGAVYDDNSLLNTGKSILNNSFSLFFRHDEAVNGKQGIEMNRMILILSSNIGKLLVYFQEKGIESPASFADIFKTGFKITSIPGVFNITILSCEAHEQI